jgi:hypothetical protein
MPTVMSLVTMPAKRNLPFHPLADVLPLIKGVEFDQLVDSIMENGLHDPIILLDGAILDGRNRYLACLKAGVEPRTITFSGGDPVAFVMDRNLHRRQLTVGQRAMALEKFATLSVGRPSGKLIGEISPIKTATEVAALAGVNQQTIRAAKTIKAEGTPKEIAAVTSGERAIHTVANEVRKRRPGGGRKKGYISHKRQLAIFFRAVSSLCNICETAAELEIPKLDAKQRKTYELQLIEAQQAIRVLRRRTRGAQHD